MSLRGRCGAGCWQGAGEVCLVSDDEGDGEGVKGLDRVSWITHELPTALPSLFIIL